DHEERDFVAQPGGGGGAGAGDLPAGKTERRGGMPGVRVWRDTALCGSFAGGADELLDGFPNGYEAVYRMDLGDGIRGCGFRRGFRLRNEIQGQFPGASGVYGGEAGGNCGKPPAAADNAG